MSSKNVSGAISATRPVASRKTPTIRRLQWSARSLIRAGAYALVDEDVLAEIDRVVDVVRVGDREANAAVARRVSGRHRGVAVHRVAAVEVGRVVHPLCVETGLAQVKLEVAAHRRCRGFTG